MDSERTRAYMNSFWDEEILPTLDPCVAIPPQSVVLEQRREVNEFLDIAMGEGVTLAVAHMMHRFPERVCEAR